MDCTFIQSLYRDMPFFEVHRSNDVVKNMMQVNG
jgi:hypothetical protein